MKTSLALVTFALLLFLAPAITNAQGATMCTQQYQPVCGTEKGVYKTYGNGCMLGTEKAVYQHEGECTASELSGKAEAGVTYTPPAHCVAWNDGCNSCSRGTNGQTVCTLMACMGAPRAGYCSAYGDTEAPPASGTTVTTDTSTGSSVTDGTAAMDATTTATTTKEFDPGFFFGIWNAIAAWFRNLF